LKQIILIILALLVSSCASRNLTGAGREGAYVNDALPEGATIYGANPNEIGDTSEPDGHELSYASLVWEPLNQKVSCSEIRGVEYFRGGGKAGDLKLKLVGHTYGGKYYPPPPRSRYWIDPRLWVEEGLRETQAEFVASHCGVDFHVRN